MQLFQLICFAALGIGAGVSVVVQQVLVASLTDSLGSAPWAAFISYVGGTLTMVAVLLVMREPWVSLAALAKSSWAGGAFGVIYIVLAILLIPQLGAATVLALIVTGQLLASLAFDHFGLFGLPQQPADVYRT